jgi:hypothetical protein
MLTVPTPKYSDPVGEILCHTKMRRTNAKRVQDLADDPCDVYSTEKQRKRMTPDELIKILQRCLTESNQNKRLLAIRIGVNHHTLHHWLTSDESSIKGGLTWAACILRRAGYL